MPEQSAFRRNLLIVAALHVAFISAVWLLSQYPGKKKPDQVLWLESGSVGGGKTGAGEPEPAPPDASRPEPEPPAPVPEKMELVQPPPVAPPAPSEIVTPQARPAPTPPPTATPKPTTPKPTTPKSETPKPTTPKATPKETPKSTPKSKATPNADASPKPKSSPAEKPKGTPGTKKTDGAATAASARTSAEKAGGNGPGTGNGKGTGKTGNGTGEPQFGWYFSMLHDRFHNRWEQPTSIVRAGADFVTTLKIRIAKDGMISAREIVNSSGNPVMDESVLAAAKKVEQIDPLPAGLGDGEFFEIKVNFKLDQGQ